MPVRIVHAIRHLGFEDLGSFAAPLREAGGQITYHEATDPRLASLDPLAADVLVVLGGPIGVYDDHAYPFLAVELALLRARLAAGRPTLGVCLGAQMIAAALGARVYPGGGREIGWSALTLTDAGATGPLAPLAATPVLHWHGDTFDLPDGCTLLASTDRYRHQAFSRGEAVLALQFHAEVTGDRFEDWLVGNATELAAHAIDPIALRAAAARHAPALEPAAHAMIRRWLAGLD